MFKVDGLWSMVFWQRTQRQNVLMMFPYGPKYKRKKDKEKRKKNRMSNAKDDGKKKKNLCSLWYSITFLRFF